MDRRVTLPKRVTSPTWGPSPPSKQALITALYQAVSFQSPDFSPIQKLYLLPVLGGHLY